jgi:hypothetical protein
MKVEPIGSNQTQVTLASGDIVLYSYNQAVAVRVATTGVPCVYVTDYKWSRTTSKHINKFVDGDCVIKFNQAQIDRLANGELMVSVLKPEQRAKATPKARPF